MRRMAWVVSHPIQYQVPVFRRLAAMPDLDLTVVFLSEHGMQPSLDPQFGVRFKYDVPLLDGYHWVLAEGRPRHQDVSKFFGVWAAGLRRALQNFDAVVVAGWGVAGYLQAVHLARRDRARVIHLSESTLEDHHRPVAVRAIKRGFFKWHIRPEDHALAIGTRSRRYLEYAGVSPSHIHPYPYTTDTALTDAAWPHRSELRSSFRRKLAIELDDVVFLFSGKLMPKKDPLAIVDAFLTVPGRANLVFVGAGELEPEARRRAARDPRIHFLGFRNQTELPEIYAGSDVLVLPSYEKETWGLVVNEAMAMGCAIIVSDRVGSSEDLVEGKGTGIVVPAHDAGALANAMQRVLDDRGQLAAWKERARLQVSGHTPERAAAGVREAVLA